MSINDDNEEQGKTNRRRRFTWMSAKNDSRPFSLRREIAKFEFWFYLACAAMLAVSQLLKCGKT
jgi:hypothetical protein